MDCHVCADVITGWHYTNPLFGDIACAVCVDIKKKTCDWCGRFKDVTVHMEKRYCADCLSSSISDAWYRKTIIARPSGNIVSGVSVKDINVYLSLNGRDSTWCYANALTRTSFTSIEESIRSEIDEDMWWGEDSPSFQASGVFTGRGKQNAIVGIFEDCNGRQGSFILITDRSQPKKIVFIKELHGFAIFLKLIKSKVGDSLVIYTCLGCGEWYELSYDVKRKRFYWYGDDSN